MRVLLVDDEDGLRRMLARALTRAGHEVVDFPSAAEALAWSGDHAPDLLVTDMTLESMTGMALAETLLDRFPSLPVIFISGYPADVAKFQEKQPASVFLRKPFSAKELSAAIAEITR